MAITLCSLPVKILLTILLIVGWLDLEFHKVHTLIFEEVDSFPRCQILDKPSMSTKSYFIISRTSYLTLRIGVFTRMLSNSIATFDPSVSHWT